MTSTSPGGPMTKQPPRSLSDLREKAGLGVQQLADRMGLHRTRITAIEARYPNLNYQTVARYIEALGGDIHFTVGSLHADASTLTGDPNKRQTRAYLATRPGKGNLVYRPSGSAEELPLQGDAPESGGDDTGGQVDQADTESDQGDGDEGQQA